MENKMNPTLLCLASYFKGEAFLEKAHELGCRVILITKEKLADEAWPMASIDERYLMPELGQQPDIIYAVSYLARERTLDRVIPLDDYDVQTAAQLREHLRLPGMGTTQARYFRDKLAMRMQADAAGLAVPAFSPVFHYEQLNAFLEDVPAPWVLKPRSEAGAMGIKKLNQRDEVWHWLAELGDEQSSFLLEQYVPGEVYHVDGIVHDGEVAFSIASKYGQPPMDVAHGGGVFITRTLPADDAVGKELLALNERLQQALGMVQGATHTEFIRGGDGTLYFLETAARVGGANIHEMVEAATGVNLWHEWAKLEVAEIRGGSYTPPSPQGGHAGLMVCLARQEWPDLSGYDDPEVIRRLRKKQHAGLIIRADDEQRVQTLLDEYSRRFAQDFLAVVPPLDRPPT
jgi:biotin carboxylase